MKNDRNDRDNEMELKCAVNIISMRKCEREKLTK